MMLEWNVKWQKSARTPTMWDKPHFLDLNTACVSTQLGAIVKNR
jgi:hypothetical protein